MSMELRSLNVSMSLYPETPLTVSPITSYPDRVVVSFGRYGPAEVGLSLTAVDVGRLETALAEARVLLQSQAASVAA